ncbi:MAG TPA: outer membrane beta-barrel protein [Bryobacteraceae bacterium]|nr:outer membrane beta-barrel protein [Bryobacteraceae bacterium]
MNKLLWPVLFLSSAACAQPFGAGVKLGSTLTDALSSLPSVSIANSAHFIVGPYLELRLPLGFAVEADALYERGLYNAVVTDGSTWQFPVVAKYKFGEHILRPYIEGGPSFSRIADIAELPFLNHRNNFGVALGAGIEMKVLFVRVSPEIRYYFMAAQNLSSALFESNRNQATFTIGFGL